MGSPRNQWDQVAQILGTNKGAPCFRRALRESVLRRQPGMVLGEKNLTGAEAYPDAGPKVSCSSAKGSKNAAQILVCKRGGKAT